MDNYEVIDMGLSQYEREHLAHEVVHRAIEKVYPSPEQLSAELAGFKRLNVYMGLDPTAPDLHIGHESQLLKLKKIQQLGHRVIMLIGDFTATIGDPTDKTAARVKLTREQVMENAKGYKDQASKVLDFDHPNNPVEIKYNSEWLGKMSFADVLELASEFTVQQMLERDMFEKRISAGKPVGVHEFIYPLMQGWDSVNMDIDIEVGGSDQIFNMFTGTTLVRRHLKKQKYVIAGKLLADPEGKKMGKTENNMIKLTDSATGMYEKIMRWNDAIVPIALEACTELPMDELRDINERIKSNAISKIESKKILARALVSLLFDAKSMEIAETAYDAISSNSVQVLLDNPDIGTLTISEDRSLADVMVESRLANSKSDARRLIKSGAVTLNNVKIDDEAFMVSYPENPQLLQVGKKRSNNIRKLMGNNNS